MKNVILIALLCSAPVLTLLAGCGQKDDLFLPGSPQDKQPELLDEPRDEQDDEDGDAEDDNGRDESETTESFDDDERMDIREEPADD